jgi:hypothetical protein
MNANSTRDRKVASADEQGASVTDGGEGIKIRLEPLANAGLMARNQNIGALVGAGPSRVFRRMACRPSLPDRDIVARECLDQIERTIRSRE